MAPWMVDAIELGFTDKRVRSKVTTLRASKAKKFGITIPVMEVVFGWDLDEMAGSLIHAIKNERCRGPRCRRRPFAEWITSDALLELITCDVLDPETAPLWCMNIRWVCSQDNKGDRDDSMRVRAQRLVAERMATLAAVPEPMALEIKQLGLFDEP
jgi:hypothetical protein